MDGENTTALGFAAFREDLSYLYEYRVANPMNSFRGLPGVEAIMTSRYPGDRGVNAANLWGKTPLMVTIIEGHADAAEYLLHCPYVDIDKRDSNGKSALDYAKASGDSDTVRKIESRDELVKQYYTCK